mmetsp:Transcript_16082/g.21257  ORF Transcript_16082/g.21257 Transcript_16082/m.21257 type:complete len:289 (+) Transcript_16082:88-954(+)
MEEIDVESISSETVRKERADLAKKRSAYDEDFGRRLGLMNKQIVNLETLVLEKRKEVHDTANRQEKIKNAKQTTQMLKTWQKNYGILKGPDQKLRPPDQRFPVRITSRMDTDLWASNELRGWFHKNAKDVPFQETDPMLASDYGIRQSSAKPSSSLKRDSRRLKPLESSQTGRMLSQSRSTPALHSSQGNQLHWSNYEGNLQLQKQASSSKLQNLHQVLDAPEHGHMVGIRPPWQENPAHLEKTYVPKEELRHREEFLLNGGGTENYLSDRDLTYMRKIRMEGGSGFM